MKVETFYDFRFRARHALGGRSEAAAHPHWHSYTVRLWFSNQPDQDGLSEEIEYQHQHIHGIDLPSESTDEWLAKDFLEKWETKGCFRVRVTNDERRGAEASL